MTELNLHRLHVAHMGHKVMKIFDNPEEGLKYAEYLKEQNIKVSVDPLFSFLSLHTFDRDMVHKLKAKVEQWY